MSQKPTSPLAKIKLSNAIYPILIGVAVVGWLVYKDFDPKIFSIVHWTWATVFWLIMAVLFMVGRDVGYMIRIRVLSDNELTWRAAFRVIMLWEFTSAITPSAVGGTSVAIVYVHKEGIGVGRSSTIVMLTSFLDEIYFIIAFPLVMWLVGVDNLFLVAQEGKIMVKGLMSFALIGYCLKFLYVIIISYGLFFNPRGLKWLIIKIFKFKYLRRWLAGAQKAGTDIVLSAGEIRNRKWRYWAKVSGATALSWSSRYLVANALILAFFSVSDNLLLFARQLVMWIMMLVMPSPGGSGFAEVIFTTYCSDLIDVPIAMQAGAAALIAFLWRGVTYYPYLAIGAVIFPRWIKRHFAKGEK